MERQPSDRDFLCAVCGGIFDPPVFGPDGRGEGTCPDCGHGYSTVLTTSAVFTGIDEAAPAPERPAVDEHHSRQERILRDRPFPVFGLDTRWTGSRWMGGWGRSGEIERITLAHGDPLDDSAPLVRVSTRLLSPFTIADSAHELADYMWMDADAPHELVRPTFTSEDPTASWSELTLPVDHHPTPFRSLAHAEHWVALSNAAGRLITIEARHLGPPDVALATIRDIEPYLSDPPTPS